MPGPAVVKCNYCGGTGLQEKTSRTKNAQNSCGVCSGVGSVVVYLSLEGQPVKCAKCEGSGIFGEVETCFPCMGSGWAGRLHNF